MFVSQVYSRTKKRNPSYHIFGDEDGIATWDRQTMARATFGHLAEFDATSDSVTSYVERAQLFLDANDIAAEKRVAVFLSAIGGKTYTLLRNLLAPAVLKEKTLDEIITALKQHFEPKPIVIAERFHFHRRNQVVGESVADFVAELRRLATHCEFQTYLDEALRDRFVCGLRSEAAQKRLLTETKLTFQRAVEIAQGMESAAENARKLQSPSRAAGLQTCAEFPPIEVRSQIVVTGAGSLTTSPPSVLSGLQSAMAVAR